MMRGEEHIMLTWEGLNSYVNFGIQDICYTGRTNPNENHCAHFVCHALGISHGGEIRLAAIMHLAAGVVC
jgi:hypothetical protein